MIQPRVPQEPAPWRWRWVLVVSALVVLGWRLTTALARLDSALAGGATDRLMLATDLMGLGFLVCGLVAFFSVGSWPSVLFAFYGASQALHWGGPVEAEASLLRTAILCLYFVVSMLGVSAALHFILLFPRPWGIAERRSTLIALYLPVVLALALGIAIVLVPSGSPSAEPLQALFLLLETVQVNLYPLLALVVLAVRVVRATAEERWACGLFVMLGGAVLAVLPWLVVLVLQAAAPDGPIPGDLGAQPYTLLFLLEPLAFLYAILKTHRWQAGRA